MFSILYIEDAQKKKLKPWITQDLQKSIRMIDRLSLAARKNPNNSEMKIVVRRYRNKLNELIKQELSTVKNS